MGDIGHALPPLHALEELVAPSSAAPANFSDMKNAIERHLDDPASYSPPHVPGGWHPKFLLAVLYLFGIPSPRKGHHKHTEKIDENDNIPKPI